MASATIFRRIVQLWSAAIDSLLTGSVPGQVPIWDDSTLLWYLNEGGILVVADEAARDALPAGILTPGLQVTTIGSALTWIRNAANDDWGEWSGLEISAIQQSNGALTGYLLTYDENALAVGRGAWVPTPPGSTVQPFDFIYSNNAAMADPGVNTFRTNATLITTATQLALSNDPIGPIDDLLAFLGGTAGSIIRIDQDAEGVRWGKFDITSFTDNGAWILVDVTFVEGGTTDGFQNGATCTIYFTVEGGGSVVTEHNQLLGLGWESSGHAGLAKSLGGWDTDPSAPEIIELGPNLEIEAGVLSVAGGFTGHPIWEAELDGATTVTSGNSSTIAVVETHSAPDIVLSGNEATVNFTGKCRVWFALRLLEDAQLNNLKAHAVLKYNGADDLDTRAETNGLISATGASSKIYDVVPGDRFRINGFVNSGGFTVRFQWGSFNIQRLGTGGGSIASNGYSTAYREGNQQLSGTYQTMTFTANLDFGDGIVEAANEFTTAKTGVLQIHLDCNAYFAGGGTGDGEVDIRLTYSDDGISWFQVAGTNRTGGVGPIADAGLHSMAIESGFPLGRKYRGEAYIRTGAAATIYIWRSAIQFTWLEEQVGETFPPNTGTANTQIFTTNVFVPIAFTWDQTNDPQATVRRSDGSWNVNRAGRWRVEYSLFVMGRVAASQWFEVGIEYSTDGISWSQSDGSLLRVSYLGEQWAQQTMSCVTWFDAPGDSWVRLVGRISTGTDVEIQKTRVLLNYLGPI